MSFLYFLEGLRNPIANKIFSVVTIFGEETFFLIAVLFIFWCIDKRKGFYIMFVGFLGMELNTLLKMTFRVPRPWVLDEHFTIVESARATATGYSFPSGHTQISAGTFGCIARSSKDKRIRIGCIAALLLVAFSRMYLGCHTPMDVATSLVIAAILIFAIYPILYSSGNETRKYLIMFAIVSVTAVFVMLYVMNLDVELVDLANLADAYEITAILTGLIPAMIIGWFIDAKYIHFSTKASLAVQVRKMVLGLVIVLLLKEELKVPLSMITDNSYISRGIRYFLILLFSLVLWPMTFPKEQK